MPIFVDRHEIPGGMTSALIAELHSKDQAIQGQYGVNFMTYWCDPVRKCAFCLVDAPDAETALKVHRLAHGEVPHDIIEVEISAVMAFLGRISDPAHAAEGQGILESAHRTVMFTDIVNSMEMTARLGDTRAMEMVRAHDGIVRPQLAAYHGREVKHTGDGIMAAFDEPRDAVLCACEIQRGVRDFNRISGETPLHVRIGIHTGAPVEENKDLFGQTVQIASRICGDAAVDAVAITESVRALLAEDVACASLGRRVIKGLSEPIAIFAVGWE